MQEEIVKCYNPNIELPMCRECMRSTSSKSNEYETFNLIKNALKGHRCDGYISKRETKTLL